MPARAVVSLSLIDRAAAFRKALDGERARGRRVGLVPTMGALHAGHTSLMERARRDSDVVAATVFVNPLQFGPGEDLAAYPRDGEGDRGLAEQAGVAYLFVPPDREMFPEPPATTVNVAGLSERFEGAMRPGHFAGVATVVTKLLALAGPCAAYFGEKDFQQLAVIRRLVADLSLPVDVVACPTVRDPDGLALSSRNAYLTPAERAVAPILHQALQAGRRASATTHGSAEAVREAMRAAVAAEAAFTLDYADVVDPADFTPLEVIDRDARLIIAARLGRTRLIDNLALEAMR